MLCVRVLHALLVCVQRYGALVYCMAFDPYSVYSTPNMMCANVLIWQQQMSHLTLLVKLLLETLAPLFWCFARTAWRVVKCQLHKFQSSQRATELGNQPGLLLIDLTQELFPQQQSLNLRSYHQYQCTGRACRITQQQQQHHATTRHTSSRGGTSGSSTTAASHHQPDHAVFHQQ